MNVIVDGIEAVLFTTRMRKVKNDRGQIVEETRCYYSVPAYPGLLLVTCGYSLKDMIGRKKIALFNFETDSTVVCDSLPEAPKEWRQMKLTQCTVKAGKPMLMQPTVSLSEALRRKVKP